MNIIRRVVKEELENHDKKFCEILKSHLEKANQRLNKISDEVVELTKSLEFTQAEVKEEITCPLKYHWIVNVVLLLMFCTDHLMLK